MILTLLLAVLLVVISIISFRNVSEDFRTSEGCAGCDGVCLENGGYCIRGKTKYKQVRSDLLWEYCDGAGKLPYHCIAVLTEASGRVSDLSGADYAWLYSLDNDGIRHRKVLSFGKLGKEHDPKVHELRRNKADCILSLEEILDKWPDMHCIRVASSLPDQAINDGFENILERPKVEKQPHTFRTFLHNNFKIYPFSKAATILDLIGNIVLFLTFLILVVLTILLALHIVGKPAMSAFAITIYFQFMGFLVIRLGERIAGRKRHKAA